MKKPLKITQNHERLSQEHAKKLKKDPLFLDIPNGFLFLDQANWRIQKSLKNDRKRAKKSYSNLSGFRHPKVDLYFWTRMFGHFKKSNKNHGN
jgi:hypothetical protein